MSRTLAQNGLGKARTLNGLSNDNIDTIKEKYDFDGNIESGTLLIGSSTGNYTANQLTAGANITITNGTGQNAKGTITIASSQLVVNAGTNLSKSTSINGDITLNVSSTPTSISTINGFSISNDISSASSQFLVKDNSVGGFANGTFLSTNSNGLIVPTTQATINSAVQGTILGGNNITKSTAGGNATLNLDATLTSITSINGYNANVLTVNNSNSQYLIKDVNLGANSILSVGSTGKISSTTPTVILSNLIAGNNLTKSSNTINLDATLTSITSINGYNANVLTVNNSNSQYLIKEASVGSFASGDFLTINSSNKVDNISRIDLNNSIVSQVFVSNGLTRTLITNNGYSSISISTSPSINLSDTMTLLNLTGQTGGNAILKIQAGSEDSFKPQIHLFQNTTLRTLLEYDKANNKFLIKAPTGLIELSGYNGTSQILAGSQNVEIKTGGNLILKVQSTGITCSRILKLNQQRLDFTTAGVHYMEFNGSSTTMDGILLSAFGGGSSTPKPFFRANCSDGNGTVFEIYKEKISMYKPLHFKTTNDARLAFLQFKEADGMNGILLKAFGINATNPATRRVLFRVECSDANVSQPILLDVGPRQVEVYKRLSVIKDTSTIQNDNNDIFTVRNAGFVKAILHSDNNTCELAFKTNNQQSTLVYTTGGHFSLTTQNDINLVNSSGKCIFQSDRNLVVYRENNSVAFAANSNGNSSRDYKDNIIDLEENESINIIKNINPVSFTYKPAYWDKTDDCNNCGCKVRRGFIWEDVKPILPTACSMIKHNGDDDGSTKMLYKEEIIPDLVKTVQYLMNKVETLEQQLENLNSK